MNAVAHQRMVITDLDGTLIRSDRTFSAANLATFDELGQRRITRVIATGRSLFSARQVLPLAFPLDYLIFSSGAGIMAWPAQKVLQCYHFAPPEIAVIAEFLMQQQIDFMLHQPIPENHRFWYHQTACAHPDFLRRWEWYREFAAPLATAHFPPTQATQFVAILPGHQAAERFAAIKTHLPTFSVIRSTSPFDGASLWIEIFPAAVSKARAGAWLARRHQIDAAATLGLGNDYNDVDLLAWAGTAFVVNNAPADLKAIYPAVTAYDQDGFSDAVKRWLIS